MGIVPSILKGNEEVRRGSRLRGVRSPGTRRATARVPQEGSTSVERYDDPVSAPSADRISVASARVFTLRLAGTEDQSPMTFFTISGISAFMVVKPTGPVIFLIFSHRPGSRMSSRN